MLPHEKTTYPCGKHYRPLLVRLSMEVIRSKGGFSGFSQMRAQ